MDDATRSAIEAAADATGATAQLLKQILLKMIAKGLMSESDVQDLIDRGIAALGDDQETTTALAVLHAFRANLFSDEPRDRGPRG